MTDWPKVQRRLIAGGYEIGAADGVPGRKTFTALLAYVAGRPMAPLAPLGEGAALFLPAAGIADNASRLANFLGQAAHESGSFRYLREIWGPTDAQRRYEGRGDLGNTHTGDGKRYLGRGIFQLTGRANYREIGARIGEPLEDQPELAERPDIAVHTAAEFWESRGLNALADAGDDDRITKRINGGTNGLADRRRLVARAKGLFV